MTSNCATIIGIILQLLGAAYLVYQSFSTSKKLSKYRTQVTYDTLGSTIDALAHEVGGQFTQQLVGFVFVLAGSAFQLYAVAAA